MIPIYNESGRMIGAGGGSGAKETKMFVFNNEICEGKYCMRDGQICITKGKTILTKDAFIEAYNKWIK